jgi:hypothetical protein
LTTTTTTTTAQKMKCLYGLVLLLLLYVGFVPNTLLIIRLLFHGVLFVCYANETRVLQQELDRTEHLRSENASQKFVLTQVASERDQLRLEVEGLRLLRRLKQQHHNHHRQASSPLSRVRSSPGAMMMSNVCSWSTDEYAI